MQSFVRLACLVVSLSILSFQAHAQGGVERFCAPGANGARLEASGSARVDANGGHGDLVLHASSVPPNTPGLFLMSAAFTGPIPFGQGFRCISAPLVRLPVVTDATFALDYLAPGVSGLVTPGATWNFQYWFRSGSSFDLSDGLSITFGPAPLLDDVETISQGEFSAHPLGWNGGILLVQDASTWDSVWQQHTAGFAPTPPIDFSSYAVVAVFTGMVSHGGVSIAVRNARLSVGTLDVTTQVTAPGANCLVTFAITQPNVFVRVPRVGPMTLGTWTSGSVFVDCP